MIELTPQDREHAIGLISSNLLVSFFFLPPFNLTEEKIGRIADIVWPAAARICGENRNLSDPLKTEELEALIEGCRSTVRLDPSFDELRGAIPVWIFVMVLKIIISYLIDYWLTRQYYAVVQS